MSAALTIESTNRPSARAVISRRSSDTRRENAGIVAPHVLIVVSAAAGLVITVVIAAPGCGSNELDSPTAAKLKALSNFYLDYAVAKQGQGPAGEPDLKKHIRGMPDQLMPEGVDRNAIDALFVSDRDGEPFVVLYGQKITGISGTSGTVIAHEKTGKGGKRLVVLSNTKVEHVDEARFQELLSAK